MADDLAWLAHVRERLTSKGETVLGRLASVHQLKLWRIGPEIHEILSELTRPGTNATSFARVSC